MASDTYGYRVAMKKFAHKVEDKFSYCFNTLRCYATHNLIRDGYAGLSSVYGSLQLIESHTFLIQIFFKWISSVNSITIGTLFLASCNERANNPTRLSI